MRLLTRCALIALPTLAAPRSAPGQAPRPAVTDTTSADTARRATSEGLYSRHPWLPRLLGAQFSYIWQDLPPFHASYSGRNSITNAGDNEGTHTYGVYLGSRLSGRLQLYLDAEMSRGAGLGHAVGLAGLTDGDVIREGTVNLGQGPYLARAFARYLIPLGPGRDTADRAQDQVPGAEPTTRLEIEGGRWALNDELDVNRYAGSTRTQFMDFGLWQNTAWDFAANTRGYTNAVLLAFVSPGSR